MYFPILSILLLWATLIASVHGLGTTRDFPDFKLPRYKRGILVTNGKPTSCEMVPIGDLGAFVAASCLDSDRENSYSAYMFLDMDGNVVEKIDFDTDSITLHPLYDVKTRQYNMAIVDFDRDRSKTVDTQITDYTKSSNLKFEYTRIETNEQGLLNQYYFSVPDPKADYTCNGPLNETEIYYRRSLCTTLKRQFGIDASRELPYGSLLLTDGNTQYAYALYSHSIQDVSDPANSSSTMYSYYSVLLYYAPFAKKVIEADLVFMIDGSPSIVPDNTTLYPIQNSFNGTKGIIINDDLYSDNGNNFVPYVPTEMEEVITNTKEVDQETHSDDEDSEESNGESKKGLSSGATAAIAVVVSIAGIVLLAIAYRYIQICLKNRSAESYWNRKVETLQSTRDLNPPNPENTS